MLTDAQWREFQSIPEQGHSHRHWVDHHIEQARAEGKAEADAAWVADLNALADNWEYLIDSPENGVPFWEEFHALIPADAATALDQVRAQAKTEALREVRLAWQWGGWTDVTAPSKEPDQLKRVFAVAQAVTDWLTQHMREEKRNDRDSG